ncbi:MAG TPA: DUF302 domain-containing protein [Thiobacillus sp.]|nr:MAG: hypothetical protein B7Y50_14270 [Hydrogenophilales bacterium 28-61-11]OYZ56434.1 MAG: hypothetical protein B7Y21_11575 [Hydrogenophilales bacterium 16-61-112]OZA47935.1 MAG: hypothetical protein B7X81_04655 [Hydrogenophilales bacterium 17-61-76]HQT30981.1 DUF302 domain-containing protein [Thiobacillus sp.]HQT69080.1 DUF302 domain-containing protein [Thiobacillus sp.]
MKRLVSLAFASMYSLSAVAAELPPTPAKPDQSAPPPASWIDAAPTPYGPVMMQQASPPPYRDYQMNRILTAEEKQRWQQLAMPMTAHMAEVDAREAVNHFAVKYQAKPGVTFDEVIESMMLRANQINLKYVGKNQISKDFKVVLNDDSAPRIEVFSFCDIAVGRDLLRIIPEMVVFMPCRIAVMEDADKKIWVLTLDWDVTGINLAGKQLNITPELREGALAIRDKLDSVMRAGANGDL